MTSPTSIRLYGTVTDSIVDGPGLRYAVFVQGCTHGCPGCHNPNSQPAGGGVVRAIDDVVADIQANRLVHDVTLSGGEPFEQAAAAAVLARRLKELGYSVWVYTGYLYEELVRVAGLALTWGCGEQRGRCGDDGGAAAAKDDRPYRGAACATAAEEAPLRERKVHGTLTGGNASGSQGPQGPQGQNACPLDSDGVRALLETIDVLVDGPYIAALRSLGIAWRGSSNQRLIDVPASRAAGEVVLWESHEEFPSKPPSW